MNIRARPAGLARGARRSRLEAPRRESAAKLLIYPILERMVEGRRGKLVAKDIDRVANFRDTAEALLSMPATVFHLLSCTHARRYFA